MPIRPAAAGCVRPTIIHVPPSDASETFADAVRSGLLGEPKTLPCRFFYDAEGSRLFERICELPEYYPTRTEDAILREHATAMVAGWTRRPTMVELGSGSSTKTRRLIEAALEAYGRLHYIPIDVSPTILAESAETLMCDYPGLRVTGYAGDYRDALGRIWASVRRPKLVVFLGSSLGNYAAADAAALLGLIARGLGDDGRLLLGTDMAKDRATLEAAYDDGAGVTARFNRNLLVRINRELGADFRPERFAHQATYRPDRGRVEMHLVSLEDQDVRVPGAGIVAHFTAGESIHTENSHKYTREILRDLAARAGLTEERHWVDSRGYFRVQRWRRVSALPD